MKKPGLLAQGLAGQAASAQSQQTTGFGMQTTLADLQAARQATDAPVRPVQNPPTGIRLPRR